MVSVFIVISCLLAVISSLIYAQAVLKGRAKPERTTRFVLLILTTLATFSLLAQGDTVAVWLAAASMFQSMLVFGLSIKYGMGGWSRLDLFCLVIALLGIVLWQTTNNPALGLYAAIIADLTGMIPALLKTYRLPKTEIWNFYFLNAGAALFSLLAVKTGAIQAFAYPLYVMLINIVMVLLILRPSFVKKKR